MNIYCYEIKCFSLVEKNKSRQKTTNSKIRPNRPLIAAVVKSVTKNNTMIAHNEYTVANILIALHCVKYMYFELLMKKEM